MVIRFMLLTISQRSKRKIKNIENKIEIIEVDLQDISQAKTFQGQKYLSFSAEHMVLGTLQKIILRHFCIMKK